MGRNITACLSAGVAAAVACSALASSHREAPFITTRPKVDGTDFYMFTSYEAGRTGYVTLIADYQPFEEPQELRFVVERSNNLVAALVTLRIVSIVAHHIALDVVIVRIDVSAAAHVCTRIGPWPMKLRDVKVGDPAGIRGSRWQSRA